MLRGDWTSITNRAVERLDRYTVYEINLLTRYREALRRFADSLYEYVDCTCDMCRNNVKPVFHCGKTMSRSGMITLVLIPVFFLMEYAYGLCIPSCVYEHEATKTFFREVTVAIFIYVSCGRDLVTRIIADKWLV